MPKHLDFRQCSVVVALQALRGVEQHLARSRKANTARESFKQLGRQFFFQVLDLTIDGRSGDMQLFARAAKRALACNGDEVGHERRKHMRLQGATVRNQSTHRAEFDSCRERIRCLLCRDDKA